MNFSSVVSYHTNTTQCGVAKFGKQLADRLGVPFAGFEEPEKFGRFPLLSLKWSEVSEPWRVADRFWIERPYAVFWHDAGVDWLNEDAAYIFYADPSLGQPALWCPSLLSDPPVPRAAINLFAMGMATKIRIEPYRTLAELINTTTPHTFQLRMSMGIHEGSDLSDAVLKCEALAQAIGPENLSVLGILTDAAVASEYEKCQAVCAFFEKGARANNTTVHAAMQAGKPVITNLDQQSPPDWKHGVSVFDIHQMTAWPSVYELRRVAEVGKAVSANYSWDQLLEAMKGVCARSKSAIV